MANSVHEGIMNALASLERGQERKRKFEDQNYDRAVKEATLREAGFNIRRDNGGFQIERDPGYVSTKALERQKLQQEMEDMAAARNLISGSGGNNKSGFQPKEIKFGGQTFEPAGRLSASQENLKVKTTNDLYDTIEQNKIKKQSLASAKDSLGRVPQGFGGKVRMEFSKRFNPNDPALEDWQRIKMIGTDAQLLNTAKTKGAISDKEMMLFAQAAANDDIISAQRLKPVLDKLEGYIQAEEEAKFNSFQRNYGEDPRSWFAQNANSVKSFASEEEAIASGAKGPVIIAGKKAVIE